MPRHELTVEERRRGALHANASKRESRRQMLAAAEDQLGDALDRSVARLLELVESKDEQVALRACVQVFDRVLGRPRQPHEHGGRIGLDIDMTAVRARLNELIERRADRDAA